jgi:hypothetical protein
LRIDVVDTGVGIPADKIEHLWRIHPPWRCGGRGLGLGLALSERIARLLARIEVASTPGKGSRFSLWMPASAPVAAPSVAPRTAAVCARPLTVLVVDDDVRTVEASLALLTSMGHRAIGATSGEQALPHAEEIDAALLDYRLDRGRTG